MVGLRGPFQSEQFCDSVILVYVSLATEVVCRCMC